MKQVLKVTGIVIAAVLSVAFFGFVGLCIALRKDEANCYY